MSSWFQRLDGWLRHRLVDCLLALALLFGGATAVYLNPFLDATQRLVAWSVLGLILAYLLRDLGRQLTGPVLFYDLVRTARRGRYVWFRCLYASALLAVLFLLFFEVVQQRGGNLFTALSAGYLRPADVTQFTAAFFEKFMLAQFVTVALLTPACAAPAITEEKQRQTLDYLLTSDLGSLEIVLGKQLARFTYLAMVVLTGLPVLSLLQLLGGIDPNLVAAGFAATGVTLLSLTALSVWNSVHCAKPRTSVFLTYFQVAVYLLISVASTKFGWHYGTGDYFWDVVNAGNPYAALNELAEANQPQRAMVWTPAGVVAANAPLQKVNVTAALIEMFRNYTIFHGVIALVVMTWAVLALRRRARAEATFRGQRGFTLAFKRRRRPAVGPKPVVWKELYAEPLLRLSRLGLSITGAAVFGVLLLGGLTFFALFAFGQASGNLPYWMNLGVRGVGTVIACVMLLGIGVRAAGALGGERERDTLDTLLTCPLHTDDILWGKWLGSLLVSRKVWWQLGLIWVVGVATGGFHPVALCLSLAAWWIYAAFFASLGLFFSVTCRTSLRAISWTTGVALGLSVGQFLLCMCFNPLLFFTKPATPWAPMPQGDARWPHRFGEWLNLAVSPSSNLWSLAFYEEDFKDNHRTRGWSQSWDWDLTIWEKLPGSLLGLLLYLLAAAVLGLLARALFLSAVGRSSDMLPVSRRATPVEGWGPFNERDATERVRA